EFLFHAVTGPKMKLLRRLIVLVDNATVSAGELNSMAHDGAEHHLEIESRADCLAYFAERFEFANRLRQFARSRLKFLEQSDVLDGNHCLIGEGFKQFYLSFRKWPDFSSANKNRTDGDTFLE